MAVTLRLKRVGVRGHPHYRIVAAEKERPRDGKFIEVIGTYVPVNPPAIKLNEERVKAWIGNGAQVSGVVRDIIVKSLPGLIEGRENHQLAKVRAARKARKARAGGKSTEKKAPKAKAAKSKK